MERFYTYLRYIILMSNKPKRECGTCTKCCEGWLEGEALGYKFYPGKPCGALTIGKGCNSYALRPKEPCANFKCGWLANEDFPEWMKPNEVDAIINYAKIDDIQFIRVVESGEVLSSKVLSWIFLYAVPRRINLAWSIDGEVRWIGSPEFNEAMQKEKLEK
jgi:hypothetical protein